MATLIFHGHAAVELLLAGKHVWIDPFLTGNPATEADPAKVRADVIAITHGHSDHVGDAPAIAKRTGAVVAAPYELAAYCASKGAPKTEPANIGGTVRVGNIGVTFVQAWHSSNMEVDGKATPMGPACGVVIRGEGKAVYHMGDTALFSDIKLIAERQGPFDVALIPCGDRFTMGMEDALIAAKWIGAKLTIPIHWGSFPVIENNGPAFARRCTEIGLKSAALVVEESREF